MEKITLVVAQINLLVGDLLGNAQRIITTTRQAVAQYHADLVLFPELALTSYPPEDLLLRPGFYTRCSEALLEIIQSIQTTIVIGYPEKEGNLFYNKAAVIQPKKIIATYAKHILPNYAVFDENRYFSPGAGPCLFDLKGVKFGLTICEDLWHHGPVNEAVNHGAEIILSLNASPYDRDKVRVRQNTLETRIEEVHVPIVYCNLVGGQDELIFDGGSMVLDAYGKRCQQAAYYEEELMPIDIPLHKRPIQLTQMPLPPPMKEEENIYRALVLGIRDYVTKNHFPGVLIGLSGGVDSALTLALAVDALGSERVHTVMMPSQFTSQMSKEDAQKQALLLQVEYDVIDINSLYENFLTVLARQFEGSPPSAAEENLQARIRGSLLMAISNKKGYMVLTTGNKSELSVGYTTLYGDTCGGFAPLKDIPKTMVYRLCHYRNSLSPVIPERVIRRQPSAELAKNQLDQDTLPPYEVLDEILHRYIDNDQDPRSIYAAGFDQETVNKIIKMVNHNEYKRRQSPVGIRTTQRAFGKDRRYPITSGYQSNLTLADKSTN